METKDTNNEQEDIVSPSEIQSSDDIDEPETIAIKNAFAEKMKVKAAETAKRAGTSFVTTIFNSIVDVIDILTSFNNVMNIKVLLALFINLVVQVLVDYFFQPFLFSSNVQAFRAFVIYSFFYLVYLLIRFIKSKDLKFLRRKK